jgi:NAD-dependent SIR2 family protein deacetylase
MTINSELDHDTLIQRLIETVRCMECKSAYAAQDVYVVSQDEDSWTLVAVCAVCGAESVVMAYLDEPDDDELAPPDEAELAAWKCFLGSFNGDLRDLLRC